MRLTNDYLVIQKCTCHGCLLIVHSLLQYSASHNGHLIVALLLWGRGLKFVLFRFRVPHEAALNSWQQLLFSVKASETLSCFPHRSFYRGPGLHLTNLKRTWWMEAAKSVIASLSEITSFISAESNCLYNSRQPQLRRKRSRWGMSVLCWGHLHHFRSWQAQYCFLQSQSTRLVSA